MSHTLTIAGLSDFEAEHIGQILNDYKVKMLGKKLEAMVEDYKAGDGHRAEWFDEHLEWHESIMSKVKWTKNE
jgi:hypothetical protein